MKTASVITRVMTCPRRVETAMAMAVRMRMATHRAATASHSCGLNPMLMGWGVKPALNIMLKRYARPARGVVTRITVLANTLP